MINRIKRAVVTGGGNGIGQAICKRLHLEGIHVIVVDIDINAAKRVAKNVNGLAFLVDVGKESQIRDLVEDVERNIGPIDLFVSNAGVAYGDKGNLPASSRGLVSVNEDRWEASWRVNVMAHVFAARYVIPKMIERGEGHIVNIASAAGLITQIGDAAYSATKHAAVAFAESLAISHGEQGINVCVVCPQAVATQMIKFDKDGKELNGFNGNDIDGILKPEVVAELIVQGINDKQFLILPHEQVRTYMDRKTQDRERWIRGMQRFKKKMES